MIIMMLVSSVAMGGFMLYQHMSASKATEKPPAVTDAGPLGNNSNFIGIDTVNYTAIPAPGALALLGLAGLAGRRRR